MEIFHWHFWRLSGAVFENAYYIVKISLKNQNEKG